MSKIAIFGSTGMTGLCAMEAALKKGYTVKVLVRDATKVPDQLQNQIEIVEGNISHYKDVLKTVEDVSGVVVALGTRNDLKPTTELSEGVKNIIQAMKEAKVDTISVCLSAFLFHDPESGKVPAIFKDITAEHKRMYDVVKESGLNYIAVFPPHIAPDQPASSYEIAQDSYLGRVVSKYDLGEFLVDTLKQPENYGHIIGIVSKQ